jgi:hypothetical protein
VQQPRILLLLGGVILLLQAILFSGIAEDPEFSSRTLFVKHTPTWKVFFYSPIGESDITLDELDEKRRTEQLAYNEFVDDRLIFSANADRLWYLPVCLVQMALTLFSFAVSNRLTSLKKIGIHYLLNQFVLLLVFAFAFGFGGTTATLIVASFSLILNIWCAIRLQKVDFLKDDNH